MLRTTNKKVTDAIHNYILNSLTADDCENVTEQLQAVVDDFELFYDSYMRRRIPSVQDAFIDFMHGLPSSLSVDFTYYDERQQLKEWLQQSDDESNRYTDEQVDRLFHYLIFREFVKLLKKHNIEGIIR